MRSQGIRIWLLLALTGLSSCGWHAGLLAPDGAGSVGIEIFETDRKLLERNLEPIVADALGRALVDLVQTQLLAPQAADLVLRGEILNYNRRSGVRNRDNELVETGLYVLLRASLVDRRSGETVAGPITRHGWSGYALDGRGPANEADARLRVIEYVARTLVLDLFTGRSEDSPGEPQAATEP